MSDLLFRSDRTFQVWSYSVSHGQLLLRSPKDQVHQTRIDLLFSQTSSINLPMVVRGIDIKHVRVGVTRGEDGAASNPSSSAVPNEIVFEIRCAEIVGQVRAVDFRHLEDTGEYHEPSQLMTPLAPSGLGSP